MLEVSQVDGLGSKNNIPSINGIVIDLIENTLEDMSISDLLSGATQQIGRSLKASACTVRLLEHDELTVGFAWGYREARSRAHPLRLDSRLMAIVCDRQVLHIRDLDRDAHLPASRRERMQSEGFRSYLGVPMVSADRVEGIVSLYYSEPREFPAEEVAGICLLADCLALEMQRRHWHAKTQQTDRTDSSHDTAPPTVLIVEDSEGVRMLLETLIRLEGYVPVVCESGREALTFLEAHPVDLVITDLRMPEVSGWEVASYAKQRYPGVRLLLVTASLHEVSREQLQESQIDLALPKPFPVAPLMTAVSTLLSGCPDVGASWPPGQVSPVREPCQPPRRAT